MSVPDNESSPPVHEEWWWSNAPAVGLVPPELEWLKDVPPYLNGVSPFGHSEDGADWQRRVAGKSMAHAQDVLAGRAADPYQEAPGVWARIGRGATDVYRGSEVLGLRGLQLLLPESEEALKPYESHILDNNRDENSLYERGRGLSAGTDWWRIGGQLAASAPLSLLPPLGMSLRGAMATGAAEGGLIGATSAIGEDQSALLGGLEGAVGGAGLGALEREVIAPAARTLGRLFYDERPFPKVSKEYWRNNGPAAGRSIHHWLFPQRATWIPQGIRNSGLNLLELPSLRGVFHPSLPLNTWMGFARNWGARSAVKASLVENGIRLGVPLSAAGSGYVGYELGHKIEDDWEQ